MVHPDVQDEQRLTAKGRATRDRIVQAAAELIVTQGLSASNMENVRRAASVSGSQLAHYFADKSALIRAVIRRQIGVVLDFHRQPKLRDLDSFDDFERWIDLNMRYLRRIGYFGTPTYHALAGQLAKSDDTTREALASGYRRGAFWSPMPTRDSWRWSSSALTREVARWPSPIGRNGRTPMRFVSRSTICACSPPTPPNGPRARRAVYAAGDRRGKPADSAAPKVATCLNTPGRG